ncbi:MAG: GGDEF domain-containing protein [Deltaproteobacteria bacterium]|nr:GGDEF domain-containing protein [Deltaproteobacteria bacterium]
MGTKTQTPYDATSVIEDDREFREQLAKAKQAFPSFVLIAGEPLGKMFPLKPPRAIIGRGEGADISIDLKHISRHHAEVTIEEGKVWIRDLGSTNGTFVNEVQVGEEKRELLTDGDLIRCGKTVFKYIPRGNIELFYHEEMHDSANIDPLTQIYNRKYLLTYLTHEMKRSKKLGLQLCLLMFDIDFFKKINDRYGHAAGDAVLAGICQRIKKEVIRAQDVFGRLGGEEFALILPQTTLEEACRVAERMRIAVAKEPISSAAHSMPVTVSIGVTWLYEGDGAPEQMLKRADQALYQAKGAGRNCVKVA